MGSAGATDTVRTAIGATAALAWRPRRVAWAGGCFIAAVVALAAFDIVRSHRQAERTTASELNTAARVIAEQTARSIQAVDIVMRHVAQQFRQGALAALGTAELHGYLKDQAIGLSQMDGLAVSQPDGRLRAAAHLPPERTLNFSLAGYDFFDAVQADAAPKLAVGALIRSPVDGVVTVPMARRLETATGEFAGAVVARLRSAYFQEFYRDIRVEAGTSITLMQSNGRLLARHPPVDDALGTRFTRFDALLQQQKAGNGEPLRTVSSIDGTERFVALQPTPGYPVHVVVSRDAAVALAPWREQAIGTAARTLALSLLAALLIALLMRQLARLDEARRSVESSQARFAAAVTGSDGGIWELDFDNGRAYRSPRLLELLGLPPGPDSLPLADFHADVERVLHPEDVPRRRAALTEHLEGRRLAYEVDFRVRDGHGGWRWIHVHGRAMHDAAGRAPRVAGSTIDIDARKQAEERRLQLEDKLRQAQKLESIGTLAGGIAHDFNNILAAILGYGEMAQREVPEGSALRKHIDAAMSAGLRGKALVERILAFSRSGMGERVAVHVQSVIEEALEAVEASLPAGVALVRRLEAGDAGVLGDPTQIHQVVMNLCTNAAQAMKDRGTLEVTLALRQLHEPLAVAAGVLPPGEYLHLAIADTGSGIPAEVIGRIFDPFFTTKTVGVGTGLGLSLVHGIVTDLEGGIAVLSEVGRGSRFDVYLPGPVCHAARVHEPIGEAERGHGETVLLVDDETSLVRLGEETLAELGYEPVGYASSATALEVFRADPGRFDAVISDEAMPALTGTELARAVLVLRPTLPVLLMSGLVTPALQQRAHEIGVCAVLGKPLAASALAGALAAALRAARSAPASEITPAVPVQ